MEQEKNFSNLKEYLDALNISIQEELNRLTSKKLISRKKFAVYAVINYRIIDLIQFLVIKYDQINEEQIHKNIELLASDLKNLDTKISLIHLLNPKTNDNHLKYLLVCLNV